MKFIITIFFLVFVTSSAFTQVLFYQDLCNCGVTGAGFSTALGSGSGTFNIYIEPGSTIKKAWLFTQRIGVSDSVSIVINGIGYNFNFQNQVTTNYYAIGGNSAVHAIDVTNDINPTITTYNVTVPAQINVHPNSKYRAVYLWVQYEKATLSLTNSVILLNEFDLNNMIVNYQTKNLTPINTNFPVGLATYTDNLGDTSLPDGSYIYIYNDLLGLLGGADNVNSLWGWGGVKGHFYYQNNTLFGLDDDTPDSLMGGTDGLADIKSYISNNDTTFDFRLSWQNQVINDAANYYGGFFLTYTTPCNTFSTTITQNDTICFGDSIQLNATGGSSYSWFGAFGGLSDTSIANPKASPPQTTTYIVTITNDSGCVKTEQVKIWVNPTPVADTIIVLPNNCGDTIGSIVVGNIPNGTPPYNYQITNLQNTNITNQNTNIFDSLVVGSYEIQITDSNGCQWIDTVTVNEVNNVVANFTANPQSGVAPLNVDFTNTSLNANNFSWSIINSIGDTLFQSSVFSPQYIFENSGTYQVCLVAYNNIPTCADTVCQTIIVADEISFVIPNVFTPNADGENDNFVIQLTGATLIKSIKAEVFNRWGERIANYELEIGNLSEIASSLAMTELTIWDGRTTAAALAPTGTYFYVISYTTTKDEIKTEKGSVTLLR